MFETRPLTPRGRWFAIAGATAAMQFSYWPLAFAAAAAGRDVTTGGALAFGFGFVPFVFLILAFGSRHPRAPGAVLRALGLFLVFGIPIVLLDAVVGMVAGFGAGGIAALRREEERHSRRWRIVAVAAASVYTIIVLVISAELALFTGAVLPFAVLGIADQVHEARFEEQARRPD